MRRLLFLLLLFCNFSALAQKYSYVNAVNLNLREFPEAGAQVYVILHAPCRVQLVEPEDYYKKRPSVLNQWAAVKFDNGSESWEGWVSKRYLVPSSAAITVALADTTNLNALYDEPQGRENSSYVGPARKYYRGPRGGCFYYNANGNKVYVDRSVCN